MSKTSVRLVSVAVLALVAGCQTIKATEPVAARPAMALPREMLSPVQVQQLFSTYLKASQALLYSQAQLCGHANCPVQITLKTTNVDGKDYCIATVPEALQFDQTDGGNLPKTISWTLSTGTLLGRTVEFHEDFGILKVDDGKKQLQPDAHRTSPMVFEATNKHKVKGVATYVPVIIFRTATGDPELCAAGDPRIENN